MVIVNGMIAAENGALSIELPPYAHDERFKQSVKINGSISAESFHVVAPPDLSTVTVNVIGVIENQAPTNHLSATLPVRNGLVQPDLDKDVLRIALVERHRGTGEVVNAFVSGFGFNVDCAVAATVAHDSHHLIVTGTRESDMALAVNTLAEIGGGVVVIREGEVVALVELEIGGLMSTERAEVVAEKSAHMVQAMVGCGCRLHNAYMQLSLLALVVIPELRISDLGLVDVTRFQHIPVIVS
jgi:adenine deaminase